jgi:ABC-2 type transport system permease protein
MSGFYTVFKKELQDAFSSWRFIILFALVLLAGIYAIYAAAETIRSVVTGSTSFVFMALFTTSGGVLPYSFLEILAILIPIVGIALGLDAINSEKNNGTLSRLISQPIYRDTIINAKFLAGVVTIAIMISSIILLVSGLGIRMIGVPPTAEEAWRLLFFLFVSIVYGAFWLGLSILFSILFRRVATSALASIAIWLFFFIFFNILIQAIAGSVSPAGDTAASQIKHVQLIISLTRISPIQVFQEAMAVLLVPGMRTLTDLLQIQIGGSNAPLLTPLSLGQSLIMVWPHLVSLILLTVICFAISYIKFMREEIRAT